MAWVWAWLVAVLAWHAVGGAVFGKDHIGSRRSSVQLTAFEDSTKISRDGSSLNVDIQNDLTLENL